MKRTNKNDKRNAIAHEMEVLLQYVSDGWDTDDEDLCDVLNEIMPLYLDNKNSSEYCGTHRC